MFEDVVKNSCISPYYEWFRGDVIAVVPPTAKCVLSVGCAAAKTEAELVRRGVKVVGVEISPEAAARARQRGLTVLEGDVSDIDISVASESYDCLIYSDVLEHLCDPIAILERHVSRLQLNGTVIISVPNFRHYSVFWQLFVRGHIKYVDAGIMDRTHIRITTRKMVLEWFEKLGLETVICKSCVGRRRDKLISRCLLGLAKEFLGVQVLAVGKKPYPS